MTKIKDPSAWFEGCVAEIMSSGKAVELIQPWHTPVSTTPKNTGMALGGIGSAITVTPAGTTPSMHFVPGRFIEGPPGFPIRMANFFFRERPFGSFDLRVKDQRKFRLFLQVAPLVDQRGRPWLGSDDSLELLENKLAEMVNCDTLYRDNKESFSKWGIALSDSSLRLIEAKSGDYRNLNYSLLLDVFADCIEDKHNYVTSLTGDVEETSIDGFPSYPANSMRYRGLYPISETEYLSTAHRCRITKRHISPIIRNDAKACSLPLLHTEFVIENPTEEVLEISVLQFQENIVGYEVVKSRKNEQDAVFYLQQAINGQTGEIKSFSLPGRGFYKGIVLRQSDGSRQGDICGQIYMGVCSEKGTPDFDITLCGNDFAREVVTDLDGALLSGRLIQRLRPRTYSGKEPVRGGVCATKVLQPGQTVAMNFIMVLDFPSITLGKYISEKKYVHYFPDSETRLQEMVEYYFCSESSVLGRINRAPDALAFPDTFHKYQKAAGRSLDSVTALKMMSANGFSFLAESSVWDKENNFYVRECADYPFFNSLDVYFYGSFGLMYLLPECDGHNMRMFADAVLSEDGQSRWHSVYYQVDFGELPNPKYSDIRNHRGAVPHDMGNPFDPKPNAYTWNNVKHWKDLAPKFILLVLRNFKFTNDLDALKACWPAVIESINFLKGHADTVNCIPLATGVDDTFDNISSYGISIYCASLWVAGLRAAAEIAGLLGRKEHAEEYTEIARLAQEFLRNVLWDDEQGYYHHFSAPVTVSDIDPGLVGNAKLAFRKLGIPYNNGASLDVESLARIFNGFLYSRDPDLVGKLIKEHSPKIKEYMGHDQNNPSGIRCLKDQRILKKIAMYESSGGLLKESFKEKITLESDDVFADQLVADLYLSILGLEPITNQNERMSALQKIYSTNYLINSPKVGAANLVTKDGSSLPNFQAQDVWIGIQFSIAASMLDCGMLDEFNEFVRNIYRNVYNIAKVPFGVPEGFNCNNSVQPEDLTYALGLTGYRAKLIMDELAQSGAITKLHTVEEKVLSDEKMAKNIISNALEAAGASLNLAEGLYNLLMAASIKFTAGRYFRPGMIYSILSVLEKGSEYRH